jgi:opacity protein-like surface antigen
MPHSRNLRGLLAPCILAAAALWLWPSPGRAQGAPGFHIGLSGGVDIPVENQDDIYDLGWNGTLMLNVNFGTSPFGIRLDGSYGQMDVKDELDPFFVDAKTRIIDGTFDFVIGPHIGAWFQPYILGGVGVYDLRFSGQDVLNQIDFAESETRFGWNAGTGFAFRVSDSSDIHLILEGRYHSIDLDRDHFFQTGNNRFTMVTVNSGVVF